MRNESAQTSVGPPGASFEHLFRSVMPGLIALGTLKTGSRDVARELAQETMLRAHRNWSDVSRYEAPAAWCRVVMTRLLIDHHRSTAAERRATERVGIRDRSEAHLAVTGGGVGAGALDRWNALIDTLPESQKLVVTLYYGADRSVAEIAADVGRSEGAVKAALFKARRTLRTRLTSPTASTPTSDNHRLNPPVQLDGRHTSEVHDD